MEFFVLILLTLVVFTLVDLVWLVKVSPKLYRQQIGHLMADKIRVGAAAIFYIIFIFGLVYFVINPHVGHPFIALRDGALFGLITYATYDLTNLATLKNWPIKITMIDLVWGSFVTGVTAMIVVALYGLLA
jgi:uncharacterized membrane protein